ncbi:conserved hypothetical protein [Neospora caninum Liverpool]|uniref:COG4 transport protein middle alpha-helical bundle domain-containing protein n=1 Tax=Neospora caninum (strain Liverpool) TaxID=572307 RepID=F0VK92_NEOCL|nr:conserved hypothetical protein [Neospora caninum Liverpool]CBZ54493.1 conserved hypothetical protein [Neospora caninum Liverpool]CEL69206.1 TPA: hypothetical protein BN1204_049220 [Neospora caninum Liverpool]|eukprot:XP_003884523.1 conserved hypothetical protein [Neospora caninum Liverpool]
MAACGRALPSSGYTPGVACSPARLQKDGAPEPAGLSEDPLLCLLQQEERRVAAYEHGVDALLASLLSQREFRRKQARLEAELLADFQSQQTQLARATRHVEKQLKQVEARVTAMNGVVVQLETEQRHLEEAKEIVEGILELRTLKDQLSAALSRPNLVNATEAACRFQEIRSFFALVDGKYATQPAAFSLASASQAALSPPPRLCTVEAAALQQLQEMQAKLLELLFRRLSAACASAAREQREAREARRRGVSKAESEREAPHEARRGDRSGRSQEEPSEVRASQKGEWRRELVAAFSSLRALNLHQDALQRFADQLRSQLADSAARRFKALLQLQKRSARPQASGDEWTATEPPDLLLHHAALEQLAAEVADVMRCQVKALESAAGTPPACGRGNWNASRSGEAAAAGLFSIVALRQETDIQSVRILNHFSDYNEDILAMKAGDKQTATSLRRVDCVLSEIISLSARCMRLHRRFKLAASRRGSSLLLQQAEHLPAGPNAAAPQTRVESLRAKPGQGRGSASGATLVEFVRQCSACADATFQDSLLMKGREELMAHYVSLENAFTIGSIDQALNVADEVPLQSAWEAEHAQGAGGSAVAGFYEGHGGCQFSPWAGGASVPEKDEDDECFYSTVVDDVFFILNKSVLRAIGSLDVLAVCAVVNNVCSVLSSEVKAKLRGNLEESKTYYANYIRLEPHALRYSLAESLREVFERQEGPPPESLSSSYSWPHSVNNVSLAVTTLKKFKDRVARDFTETFLPASRKEAERQRRRRGKEKKQEGEGRSEDCGPSHSQGAGENDGEQPAEGLSEADDSEEEEATDEQTDDDFVEEETGKREGTAPAAAPSVQAADQGGVKEPKAAQGGASNNLMMFQYTLQASGPRFQTQKGSQRERKAYKSKSAVDGVVEELQNLHERSCRVTLKFLQPHLHRALDSLHDVVFEIHERAGEGEDAGAGRRSPQMEEPRLGLLDGGGVGDERLQERWRLQLQRGLAIILAHIGREYDRPTQNLCCSLLLQVLATKMETLLLDKTYTALGGLQLSAQLRRFLQQVSALHHASGPVLGHGVQAPLAARGHPLDFPNSVFRNGGSAVDAGAGLFGALAAAAAGSTAAAVGEQALEEEGEGALAKVKIFCDTPIRPKFGRVLELSELLSLGSLEELLDIWGPSSGKFWRLSVDEMKKVLERRVDFTRDEIEAFFHMHQGK